MVSLKRLNIRIAALKNSIDYRRFFTFPNFLIRERFNAVRSNCSVSGGNMRLSSEFLLLTGANAVKNMQMNCLNN